MTDSAQKVYIVDDDAAVRDALAYLLRSVNQAVAVFESAQTFLDHCAHVPCHGCLVLDIRMPGMSGMELLQRLCEQDTALPVIVITGHGDVPMAVEAMKLGAVDFLQKPFRDQVLLERIQQALEQAAVQQQALRDQEIIHQRLGELTPRERQVLTAVVEGKANKVIASELSLSQRTVEIHRSRIMGKMQAQSLANLVQMVMQGR